MASKSNGRPTVVTLCGSTRFKDYFVAANLRETLAGKIVLTIGCDMRTDADLFGEMEPAELGEVKIRLDELHKRKIDLSDEVLVLDVDGYIGDSTRSEIEYAQSAGVTVRYLSNEGPLDPRPAASAEQRTAGAWRPFVRKMADAMEERLRANDFKNGLPIDDPPWFLPGKLMEECGELLLEPSIEEAADVANVAGMIAEYMDAWPAEERHTNTETGLEGVE